MVILSLSGVVRCWWWGSVITFVCCPAFMTCVWVSILIDYVENGLLWGACRAVLCVRDVIHHVFVRGGDGVNLMDVWRGMVWCGGQLPP
mmetsp:Transcript_16113/g.38487  ORF Transcript_16113/g.38487 Transcript_16113/m.38487 type:complete len:89 (+) Transcript_16113:310-576(+)